MLTAIGRAERDRCRQGSAPAALPGLYRCRRRRLVEVFHTIPHADLLKSVARRIVDRHVLWLIKLWLRAPVEERDGDGKRRMSGGKDSSAARLRAASSVLCSPSST